MTNRDSIPSMIQDHSNNSSTLPLTQAISNPSSPRSPPTPPLHGDAELSGSSSPHDLLFHRPPSPILPTYEETVRPYRARPHPEVLQAEEALEPSVDEKSLRHRRKKILHYLCCVCCPCFPMWARSICCFLLFALIVFAVAAGILAALFQMPSVTFNGVTDDPTGLPRFQSINNYSFYMNLGLNFTINNPNVESIRFDKIRAIAFYPGVDAISIGGGNLTNWDIRSGSTSQFILPLELHYYPSLDPNQQILTDLLSRCGLVNGTTPKQDIAVTFLLKPTLRVIGVPISPTIHEAAGFPCPIQPGQVSLPK
ncbi:hypothetical protein DM01DRAFT_1382345 [Hesseltinella vesiculosa]|uniref:Late embryogenesis abundant protein LEA-2 subgroup domain-containing protein n=1 Tax=Hesseltinella vesiculosa TaxID=101127 RepID=A0A1X2GM10_9FUNG|nr:hypothetical protein DM01DRAFT_1382345 [Hesseltinella vesiculosa]